MKFLKLSKRDLKNSQHFDFIEAFITVCRAQGFSSAKIATMLTLLVTTFAQENELFMKVRASENIAARNEADRTRDDRYSRLHRLVLVWAGSGIATLDEAATLLKKVFDLYKLNTKAQVNEESGVMTNLCQDLSTAGNLARLETIGGTVLFNEMVAANEQVKTYRLAEGTEESEKVQAALKKARQASDEAYENVCEVIEASALLADDPAPFEAFIKQWNGTVKLYQDMLDRKASQSSSDSGSSQQGGSGSTEQGSGSGSGSGSSGSTEQGGSSGESGSGDNGGSGSGGDDNGGGELPPEDGGGFGGGSDNQGGSGSGSGDSGSGSGDNGGSDLPPEGGGGFGG